jgi:hypothetical protein
MDTFDLKKIPLVLSLVTPLIIGAGILVTVIYFDSYGISILEYISLDEALLLFLKYLAVFIAVGTPGFAVGFLLGKRFAQINPPSTVIIQSDFSNVKIRSLFILILASTISILIFAHFSIFQLGRNFFIGLTIARLIIGFLVVYLFSKSSLMDYFRLHYVSIGILMLLMIYTVGDAQAITNYKYPETKKIDLKESKFIEAGNDTIYLGKTKNFIFFGIKSKKENYIINADQLIAITTKRK